MNTPRPPRSTDPRPADERDWLAQERALSDPSGDRRDALLARALRSLPVSRPPADFAAEVARLAASGAGATVDDARLERGLLRALLALMALVALGAVAWYGGGWWALAQDALGGGAARWALVGGACLLLSWLPEGMRRLGIAANRAAAPA